MVMIVGGVVIQARVLLVGGSCCPLGRAGLRFGLGTIRGRRCGALVEVSESDSLVL